MRTIGRRHRRRTPGGDHLSQCSECRAPDLRSKLVRLDDGNLYHRSGGCQPSRTALSLSRGNAEKAPGRKYGPADGAISFENPAVNTSTPWAQSLVGWAWVNVGDGTLFNGANIELTKLSAGNFQLRLTGGLDFEVAQIAHCEPQPLLGSPPKAIPLLLSTGKGGAGVALAKVRNRFDNAGSIEPRRVVVLLYADTGAASMPAQVAWAWVKGSDGTIIDRSGANVTSSRSAAGQYTVTCTAAFTLAVPSQQAQGDPSAITPVMSRVGIDGSRATVICQDRTGTDTDVDFVVRFLG